MADVKARILIFYARKLFGYGQGFSVPNRS
jgi:hypothetical protein